MIFTLFSAKKNLQIQKKVEHAIGGNAFKWFKISKNRKFNQIGKKSKLYIIRATTV